MFQWAIRRDSTERCATHMQGNRLRRPTRTIAKALLDVSIPTLMLSLVHMSGDPDLIRGELKPAGLFLNEVQGYMSEEDKAAVRKLALEVIADYRDRGCPEPEPIGPELLQEMMQWLVCEPCSSRVRADVARRDGARRHRQSGGPSAPLRDDFPVVVIGCGESGLLAGIRLKEAGIPFTIVEKNAGVGGTWWQNTYPGARVDVGNHFYCYSFEPTDHWTHFFAEQPELQAYFQTVMDQLRHRQPRAVGDRGDRGVLGRRHGHLVGRGAWIATERRRR